MRRYCILPGPLLATQLLDFGTATSLYHSIFAKTNSTTLIIHFRATARTCSHNDYTGYGLCHCKWKRRHNESRNLLDCPGGAATSDFMRARKPQSNLDRELSADYGRNRMVRHGSFRFKPWQRSPGKMKPYSVVEVMKLSRPNDSI